MNKDAVNRLHANNGESIHVCVYYNLKNNDNVVCISMCT